MTVGELMGVLHRYRPELPVEMVFWVEVAIDGKEETVTVEGTLPVNGVDQRHRGKLVLSTLALDES
jgi:hypothetical protein